MKRIPNVSVPEAPRWFKAVYQTFTTHPDFPKSKHIRYVVYVLMREGVLLAGMTDNEAIRLVQKHYKRILKL